MCVYVCLCVCVCVVCVCVCVCECVCVRLCVCVCVCAFHYILYKYVCLSMQSPNGDTEMVMFKWVLLWKTRLVFRSVWSCVFELHNKHTPEHE